jgi:hypothetical protein
MKVDGINVILEITVLREALVIKDFLIISKFLKMRHVCVEKIIILAPKIFTEIYRV